MHIWSIVFRQLVSVAVLATTALPLTGAEEFPVHPLSDEQAAEYNLSAEFYGKATLAEGILIASSERVSDIAHREAAYQFSMIMQSIHPPIAQSIRDEKVLCIL
ncbi:MAG TPA: hypothetical protein EYG03_08555, partial [Planctomycetes bacterium]|nr:hypothetical protein [Planctomycetota bacterium]